MRMEYTQSGVAQGRINQAKQKENSIRRYINDLDDKY